MTFTLITIARITLLEASRNRLLWLLLIIVACMFGLTEFIANIAITDQTQIQLALLSNLLRYSGVVLLAIVIVSSGIREMQDKTLELILALSVSRTQYYFGKLLGFSLLCLLISIIFGLLLLVYASGYSVLVWSLSYFLELVIVASLSLLMLYSFRQVPAALGGVFLFYVLSRSLASIVLIAQGPLVATEGIAQIFIEGFFSVLSRLLPAMDRFSQTAWLVYADIQSADIQAMLLQAFIYIPLLTAIALVDFHRKNISA